MRLPPENIMCAVDLSSFTDEIFAYSVALCKQFKAKLFLVHVVADWNPSLVQGGFAIDHVMLRKRQMSEAREILEDLVKKVTVEYEIIVANGDPADEINRLSLENKIDTVICATHGKSGIKKLLIGSVTERLLKTLHCPFLVLSTHGSYLKTLGKNGLKIQKILVGCDFSSDSKLAFDYGLHLAQEFDSELYLAHVIKPTENIEIKSSDYIGVLPRDYVNWRAPDYFEIQKKITEKNRDKIANLRNRLKKQLYYMVPEDSTSWCTPHTVLLDGEPYKELIEYTKKQDIDLVVLGVRGHTLWERLMVGSTTDRVLRQAPCPVLAVQQMG